MPKKSRLTGSEIRRLRPEKRLNSSLFSLSVTQNRTGEKAACVVSKKVSPKAVVRNTVKRRMRAALTAAAPLPTGVALVLTAKPPAAQAAYAELREDVAALLERIRSGK